MKMDLVVVDIGLKDHPSKASTGTTETDMVLKNHLSKASTGTKDGAGNQASEEAPDRGSLLTRGDGDTTTDEDAAADSSGVQDTTANIVLALMFG